MSAISIVKSSEATTLLSSLDEATFAALNAAVASSTAAWASRTRIAAAEDHLSNGALSTALSIMAALTFDLATLSCFAIRSLRYSFSSASFALFLVSVASALVTPTFAALTALVKKGTAFARSA